MFLGIDVGTSEVKVLLLAQDHRVVDTAGSALEISRPHPGHREPKPADSGHATLAARASPRASNPTPHPLGRARRHSGRGAGAGGLDPALPAEEPVFPVMSVVLVVSAIMSVCLGLALALLHDLLSFRKESADAEV